MTLSLQVQSEFILESERESFIEQVREVIENADEKGLERDTSSQVNTTLGLHFFLSFCVCFFRGCWCWFWFVGFDRQNAEIAANIHTVQYSTMYLSVFISCCVVDLQMAGDMAQQIPVISVPMPGKTNKIKSLRITAGTSLSTSGATGWHT